MVEFFKAGGPVMWPLLFCAIIGIAFIIERVITYALTRVNVAAFMSTLKETV